MTGSQLLDSLSLLYFTFPLISHADLQFFLFLAVSLERARSALTRCAFAPASPSKLYAERARAHSKPEPKAMTFSVPALL